MAQPQLIHDYSDTLLAAGLSTGRPHCARERTVAVANEMDDALDALLTSLGRQSGNGSDLTGHGELLSTPELATWFNRLPLPLEIPWYGEGMLLRSSPDLENAQFGYRVTAAGKRDTTWSDSWLVIGDVSGDPVIADTSTTGTPVLYAVHGTGEWNPEPLAPSVPAFARALARWIETTSTTPILDEGELRTELRQIVNEEIAQIVGSAALPLWLGHHWLVGSSERGL